MSYTCECCKEKFYYEDEMSFFDAGANPVTPSEEEAQNPDHIVLTVCNTCLEEREDEVISLSEDRWVV